MFAALGGSEYKSIDEMKTIDEAIKGVLVLWNFQKADRRQKELLRLA